MRAALGHYDHDQAHCDACHRFPFAMTGYAHSMYAASLAEFGEPRALPGAGGSVLLRGIPGTQCRDAMGPYPLFCCERWQSLADDIASLADDAISVSLVADPFGDHDTAMLQAAFDVVVEFKQHYILDSRRAFRPRRRHRDYARQAQRQVSVELVSNPATFTDEWLSIYGQLIARHHLAGIRAFSRTAFDHQLSTPGIVAFKATHENSTIAAQLWYVMGDVVHSHLVASDPLGYQFHAMYALYASAIEHFRSRVRWIILGGGAGLGRSEDDGLAKFKRGWANDSRIVKFCGRILNATRYHEVTAASDATSSAYFPAYRNAEFS